MKLKPAFRVFAYAVIVAMLATLGGPALTIITVQAQNPFTPAEDTVVLTQNSDYFSNLDMRPFPEVSILEVLAQICEKLVILDPKMEIRDQLAEKWEANSDSSEWTFHLKKGVTFSDGDPFNAAAVKKHYEWMIGDPPSSAADSLRRDIKSIEVVDDLTVKFVMKGARPFFLMNLAESPGSYIYSPKTVDMKDEDRKRNISGTGPYKIKTWNGMLDLTLEAREDYNWASSYFEMNGPAKIKTIRVRCATDDESRLASLETGESQFITYVPDSQVARMKADPNFSIISVMVPGMPQMNYMNVTIPPTNDIRVRQAIIYATDMDEINQVVYFGNVMPAYGPIGQANKEYNPEVAKLYKFDLDKAKALLKEAGYWDDGKDGIAESHNVPGVPDGTPAEVRIVRSPAWQQYSDVWQKQLVMAGFKATIIMLAGDGPDYYNCKNQLPANGDVFVDSVQGVSRDWGKDQCGTGLDYGCACDTELQKPIDEALDRAANAQNWEERTKALGDFQMYVMEQALMAPIFELFWHGGSISSLKNVKTDSTGFYYFFYPAHWER
jgi:peptide/nickel transport system substrate-binding protein